MCPGLTSKCVHVVVNVPHQRPGNSAQYNSCNRPCGPVRPVPPVESHHPSQRAAHHHAQRRRRAELRNWRRRWHRDKDHAAPKLRHRRGLAAQRSRRQGGRKCRAGIGSRFRIRRCRCIQVRLGRGNKTLRDGHRTEQATRDKQEERDSASHHAAILNRADVLKGPGLGHFRKCTAGKRAQPTPRPVSEPLLIGRFSTDRFPNGLFHSPQSADKF